MLEGALAVTPSGEAVSESFFVGQRDILEGIVTGAPLSHTLERITRLVEEESRGFLASVLVLQDGKLRHGAAPSLPAAYNAAIDGLVIGEGVGSCGTAAATGRLTIVEDVQTHPYWAAFKDLAAEHGLRACWSSPIKGRDGSVLGTFALYYREPRTPTERDAQVIRDATHLASVAIQHDQLINQEGLRRAETAQREQLRAYFRHAPVPIAVLRGAEFVFDVANPPYEAMVGRTDVEGRRVIDVFPELENQSVLQILKDVRESSKGFRAPEYHVQFIRDGQMKDAWFSLSFEPFRNAAGVVDGVIVVAVEVTELVTSRDQLHALRNDLARQEKLSALGQLVSGVAHEIRTPLTYLATNLNLVQLRLARLMRTFTPEQAQAAQMLNEQYIPSAIEAVDRINHLVEDLRGYTKHRLGIREVVEFDHVVAEAVDIFQATNRGRAHIELDAQCGRRAEIDRIQVQQAILNLLQNALEAGPRDSTIRILTRAEGDRAVVKIQDSGRGIPSEVVSKIFDPFFTTKAEGTGLGLSIVKRIVADHHASIDLDTNDRGTTFTIRLPTKEV